MIENYSVNQLTKYTKKEIIDLFLNQQESLKLLRGEMELLNKNMNLLLEQLKVSNQARFGSSSEKIDIEISEQLQLCFNEAEVTIATAGEIAEPTIEQVVSGHTRRVKPQGKRDADLEGLPIRVEEHFLSEEKLQELFGGSYRRLPDEVYKKLDFHPATFEVVEHHVAVYCGNKNQTIVRADRPSELLKNSIVTPSLLAAVLNAKYINSLPLYRLEQEFKRYDVNISRQVMSNWVITGSERYLSLLYDRMHDELYKSHVLHADETPFKVTKDGRDTMTNSYMWVYRSGKDGGGPPAILYEYQKTRKSDHPAQFLKEFQGVVVCDGYQSYHKIANERPDELKVAGCWTHARRRFAQLCKALGKEKAKGTLAEAAVGQIAAIYHVDNSLSDLKQDEKLRERQLHVKPLVEAFFTWVKANRHTVPEKSETGKAFTYCINQEQYLRTFLEDPTVPLDNNSAEIAIRSFCVGKHNWHLIDTINGAKASAIVYSIAETAKANNLKPYNYFKFILEEIPKYVDGKDTKFLEDLLPWSPNLPDECKKQSN
ncbi:IS66 family transposase [Lachnospiraceae bacterium MD1]|uniref:IS66 family transposase n=2 Tax=Variimorphobacter saccharofermentans TaxID=2755051 RepID=A0A839K255_9FIRM|nr:IS66 family transposase [Variimorphobacter saccharofermentans]MBB2183534.1 IS66 family transposase [Variimorphobacter saccharofermentans]MBB2183995.1 IS66 family transposase [Variimorphobacter saccharofermentans]